MTDGDAGQFAARRRSQALADVLNVHVAHFVAEPSEKCDRVLAGDEGVAGIEVHPQIWGIDEG